MDGRYFAVISSVVVYLFSYLIIFYCLILRYTSIFINIPFFRKCNKSILKYIFLSTLFVTPLLVGCIFYLGGIMEEGNGIAWGCYIEDFIVGSLLIWFSLFLLFTIIIIGSILIRNKYGFSSAYKVFKIFMIQIIFSILIMIMCYKSIHLMPYSLTGIEVSCW